MCKESSSDSSGQYPVDGGESSPLLDDSDTSIQGDVNSSVTFEPKDNVCTKCVDITCVHSVDQSVSAAHCNCNGCPECGSIKSSVGSGSSQPNGTIVQKMTTPCENDRDGDRDVGEEDIHVPVSSVQT